MAASILDAAAPRFDFLVSPGLLPRSRHSARSPHALGPRFDYAVVDVHEKFVSRDWAPDRGRAESVGKLVCGEDLIAVDLAACKAAGEPVCDYLRWLREERAEQDAMLKPRRLDVKRSRSL